ncbi:MAG: hypothetical protein K1000chlam2_01748 [Chlamydiae bacterium]|nr:hypothetical protein [Chlamydiota bacterium]
MNILPLVSAFILIFAIGTYTFIHNARAAIQEKDHYASAFFIDRKLGCKIQNRLYKNAPGENIHPIDKKASKSEKPAEFHSPRDKFIRLNESKLNLSSLLEKPDPQLETVARELIEFLYATTSLQKEVAKVNVIKILIETAKKHRSLHTLEDLLSKIPKEHYPLFYKLTKGTHAYELYTSKGYPPLSDFLILVAQTQTKPINFSLASRPLLEALFTKRLSSLAINEEKHTWEKDHKHTPLKKEELTAFLVNHGKTMTEYENLIFFNTTKTEEPQWLVLDKETKVQIKVSK